MPKKKPIAVYTTEEQLERDLANSQASMGFEGCRMKPKELDLLRDAIRKGLSLEEYLRQVQDEVLSPKGQLDRRRRRPPR